VPLLPHHSPLDSHLAQVITQGCAAGWAHLLHHQPGLARHLSTAADVLRLLQRRDTQQQQQQCDFDDDDVMV
jgi:hypothetical protein